MNNETYMGKKRRQKREEIIYWIKCIVVVLCGLPLFTWGLTVLCSK